MSNRSPETTSRRVRPFPKGMLAIGRIPSALLHLGAPMGPMRLLATTGRRSGTEHRVPVVILRSNGSEWLVSPFGEVAWVHNVRSNGRAELGRGRTLAPVSLVEIDPGGTAGLLRTYRRRFGVVPFVRKAFTSTGADPEESFAAEAAEHPVFRIDRPASAR